MRVGFFLMIFMCSISNIVFAQQRQTFFSVDSRVGYSSNTYLNPYFSEWDRSLPSSYGVVSGMGQTAWFDKKNSFELTGAGVFEPFVQDRNAGKGGLGFASYQRKLSGSFSGGLEAGGSYFSSSFDRSMVWVYPTVSWFITPYTKLKVKAGSDFQSYKHFKIDSVSANSSNRLDLYAMEFETWVGFRWQLTAGLYGNLDSMPAIQKNFNSIVMASYIFNDGLKLRLKLGMDQYQSGQAQQVSSGSGTLSGSNTSYSSSQGLTGANRIYHIGFGGTLPVTNQLSVFADAEGMQFQSSSGGNSVRDIQVSGGIRITMKAAAHRKINRVTPQLEKTDGQEQIKIHYSKKGQLYLTGDFNNWKRPGVPLVHTHKNVYVTRLNLNPGTYQYKVLRMQDGKATWVEFSNNAYTVDDGFGGQNGLLLIEK